MKKAGTNISTDDFENRVGVAMRNGDLDANPHVTQAAQAWRKNDYEPFKQEAIDMGVLGIIACDGMPCMAYEFWTPSSHRGRSARHSRRSC